MPVAKTQPAAHGIRGRSEQWDGTLRAAGSRNFLLSTCTAGAARIRSGAPRGNHNRAAMKRCQEKTLLRLCQQSCSEKSFQNTPPPPPTLPPRISPIRTRINPSTDLEAALSPPHSNVCAPPRLNKHQKKPQRRWICRRGGGRAMGADVTRTPLKFPSLPAMALRCLGNFRGRTIPTARRLSAETKREAATSGFFQYHSEKESWERNPSKHRFAALEASQSAAN